MIVCVFVFIDRLFFLVKKTFFDLKTMQLLFFILLILLKGGKFYRKTKENYNK